MVSNVLSSWFLPRWFVPKGTYMKITKEYRFESAHVLPWHLGKCGREHGHSYILQVTLEGQVLPDDGSPSSGMVMDFSDVSKVVKPVIEKYLDHYRLNDTLEVENPTAERILEWLVARIEPEMPLLHSMRLYETATGWVDWERSW